MSETVLTACTCISSWLWWTVRRYWKFRQISLHRDKVICSLYFFRL